VRKRSFACKKHGFTALSASSKALAEIGGFGCACECEMHERIVGKYFKEAERRHLQTFQKNGKAINDKVRLYAPDRQQTYQSQRERRQSVLIEYLMRLLKPCSRSSGG
jgi:hypothetical protein